MALECRDISVRFGGTQALLDVALDVPDRAIVGLIGPNGAGKTTLLGVMSGFVRPQRGVINFNGHDVTRWSPARRARGGLSRSFQTPSLVAELTVQEHLVLALRCGAGKLTMMSDLFGRSRRSASVVEKEMVDQILDDLNLGNYAYRVPAELPPGVQRLAELAQSIAQKPRVLLLDEPSASLDRTERAALRDEILSIRDRLGISIVLVEHDLDLVLTTCDEILVLNFGTVLAHGLPEEIRVNPHVIAAYVGEPETEEVV
jgi:branched-chain amino acid transport system ATP-binding protein